MFKVVDFEIEDIKPLLNEPINQNLKKWVQDDYKYAKHISKHSLAITGMVNDEVMWCAFLFEIWNGRGYLVMVLSENIKKHSISVYRGMKQYLLTLPFNRIEFDCPVDMELAHKRAKFMGFKLMCERARKYLPDGGDAAIYEWVRS